MRVVVATMRRLLHLFFGVLKSGKPFDPQFGLTGHRSRRYLKIL